MRVSQVGWEGGLLKVGWKSKQTYSSILSVATLTAFPALALPRRRRRGVYLKATSRVSHLTRVQLSMCLICCRSRLKAKRASKQARTGYGCGTGLAERRQRARQTPADMHRSHTLPESQDLELRHNNHRNVHNLAHLCGFI